MTRRNAFTLIEVMIVLTIVVSVMAIAWPRMRGLAAKTQLREAAIEFKSACIEARDHAVRSGKPVYVRYKFGQSKFQLSHAIAIGSQATNTIQVRPAQSADSDSPWSEEYELAIGMVFDDPQNQRHDSEEEFGIHSFDEPDKLSDQTPFDGKDKLAVGNERQPVDWSDSEQITFFPEGRSTSAVVRVLASDNGDSIMLTIRGLTAGVTVGDVEKSPKQPVQDGANEQPRRRSLPPSPMALVPLLDTMNSWRTSDF